MRNLQRTLVSSLTLSVLAMAATAQQTAPVPQQPPPAEFKRQAAVTTAPDLAAKVPAAKPDDVRSVDAIMHAVYDVISGPAGSARDWNRFRSLFLPTARFTAIGKAPDGSARVVTWSVEDYIHDATGIFTKEAFFENGIVNQPQAFGGITQIFSSYESRHAPGEKPFQRGVNSFQLLNDGTRWWVVSILWDSERPDNPLPGQLAGKP
jgi:hypothetical protein